LLSSSFSLSSASSQAGFCAVSCICQV
jgi:hypothetical protein